MKIKSLLLITLLAFIQIVQVQAQTESGSSTSGSNYGLPKKQDYDRWSVGLTFGVSHLLGDLLKGAQNNNRFLDQGFVKPAFGLQIHHQVSHSIGLRVRGMMSSFSGNDEEYLDSVNY